MKNNPSDRIACYFEPLDIHELRREVNAGTAASLLLAVLLTLTQGINLYALLVDLASLWLCLVFHLLLLGTVLLALRRFLKAGMDARFLYLLLETTAVLGPFGSAGTVISILLCRLYTRGALPFGEWFRTIFPRDELSRPQKIYEDITSGRDEASKSYSVIPFLEVLTAGTEAQKRQALSKMTSRFHPSFAPAFHKALHDASNSIRVQAATAIAKIENAFLAKLIRLAEIKRRIPKDPAVTLALAAHYDDYAYTGILDEEREQESRRKAFEYYREYLRQKPEDMEVRIRVGRLLLRSGDADAAADWFRESIAKGFTNDTLLLWHLEALYESGRYEELRKAAQLSGPQMEHLRQTHPALAESVRLWTGAAA
jgi:polysaccharide biosynthesis protein PelE